MATVTPSMGITKYLCRTKDRVRNQILLAFRNPPTLAVFAMTDGKPIASAETCGVSAVLTHARTHIANNGASRSMPALLFDRRLKPRSRSFWVWRSVTDDA